MPPVDNSVTRAKLAVIGLASCWAGGMIRTKVTQRDDAYTRCHTPGRGTGLDENGSRAMWTILAVIVVAGLAGGAVNYALSRPERWEARAVLWSAVPGLGAAFLIPLFLQTISSSLIVDLLNNDAAGSRAQYINRLLVFGGFCLLAAISSKRFIETLSEKVTKDLRDTKKTAERALETADRAERDEMQARAAADSQRLGLVSEEESAAGFVAGSATMPEITPGDVSDDPWAGRFGGQPIANNRRLEAKIRPHPDYADWCLVRLRVLSTDPKRAPLSGAVQFYLHQETFSNYKPTVRAVTASPNSRLRPGAPSPSALLRMAEPRFWNSTCRSTRRRRNRFGPDERGKQCCPRSLALTP